LFIVILLLASILVYQANKTPLPKDINGWKLIGTEKNNKEIIAIYTKQGKHVTVTIQKGLTETEIANKIQARQARYNPEKNTYENDKSTSWISDDKLITIQNPKPETEEIKKIKEEIKQKYPPSPEKTKPQQPLPQLPPGQYIQKTIQISSEQDNCRQPKPFTFTEALSNQWKFITGTEGITITENIPYPPTRKGIFRNLNREIIPMTGMGEITEKEGVYSVESPEGEEGTENLFSVGSPEGEEGTENLF